MDHEQRDSDYGNDVSPSRSRLVDLNDCYEAAIMTHKGRCFRDRRKAKARKRKQEIMALRLTEKIAKRYRLEQNAGIIRFSLEDPKELHNAIAEAIGEPKPETSFKRRSW
jgi:hypothetical protein